ncbi:hypothetical protein C7N43_32595 [Sphingobacteriales bacterium UPWRP_1]|nr:hypothetical protein B6N25_11640 [Sphingobacteriales bacterium TSM_CSS]PSJ72766.1 hypothetical protein C7N43_32595 [Sphingobacteriales bacterium UPWRP_1]
MLPPPRKITVGVDSVNHWAGFRASSFLLQAIAPNISKAQASSGLHRVVFIGKVLYEIIKVLLQR